MKLDSMSFFKLASQRMHWLGTRQQVISENIANSDTPGYEARDVTSFDSFVGAASQTGLVSTNARHITGSQTSGVSTQVDTGYWEKSLNGNTVVLEQQTIKSNDTFEQYKLATRLYQKGINLLNMSISGDR